MGSQKEIRSVIVLRNITPSSASESFFDFSLFTGIDGMLQLLMFVPLLMSMKALFPTMVATTFPVTRSFARSWLGQTRMLVFWMRQRYLTVAIATLVWVVACDAFMTVLVTIVTAEEQPTIEGVMGGSLAPLTQHIGMFGGLAGPMHLGSEFAITDP